MATFTMSQLSSNVKAVHTGIIVAASALSLTVTATAASIFRLSKVPNGATLLDFWLKINTKSVTTIMKIGTSNSPSGIMAITTLSQTYSLSVGTGEVITFNGDNDRGYIRCPGGTTGGAGNDLMPVHISLSDDVQPAEVWIDLELTADICQSAVLTWCLFYTMDGMPGHTTIR